jgi:hypothetical protein
MGGVTVDYRSINIAVRPARVAVRIGRHPNGWEPTVIRILESLSVTWGGAGDIIVPADDAGHVDSAVWQLTEVHDPDIWAAYAYTFRGREMAQPDRYARFLDKQVEDWLAKNEGNPEQVRSMMADSLRDTPTGGWPPPERAVFPGTQVLVS